MPLTKIDYLSCSPDGLNYRSQGNVRMSAQRRAKRAGKKNPLRLPGARPQVYSDVTRNSPCGYLHSP
jgi:hypothetical protein